MTEAYPLEWPAGWDRTEPHKREKSQFEVSRKRAINDLLTELNRLGARNVIISTNVETYTKGGREVPYANQMVDDPGVAVYFTLDGTEQCIPCDKWKSVRANLRAVGKTIQALRGIERWGAKEMIDAAFRGFQALPSPDQINLGHKKPWHVVLQVSPDADKDVVKSAYKRLARKYHPDNQDTGDADKFHELQEARKEAGL